MFDTPLSEDNCHRCEDYAEERNALRATIEKNEADYKAVLDSYAYENQCFHDKIEALLAAWKIAEPHLPPAVYLRALVALKDDTDV